MKSFTLSLLILFSSGVLDGKIPPYVKALEGAPLPLKNPATAPRDWILAHVDVETTGLVPGYHEMIDMGVVMTDLEGNELDRLFIRIMPDHPERISPGAAAVNGFSVDLWKKRGYVRQKEAVEKLVAFHRKVAAGRHVLFVAYNAWFDISFVDHLFRDSGRTWRELYYYFVLDLPSMLWGLGLHDLSGAELAAKLGIEEETHDPLKHTGMTGAVSNLMVYRALLKLRGGG